MNLRMSGRFLLRSLADFLFPRVCYGCNEEIDEGLLCEPCRLLLLTSELDVCPGCGRPCADAAEGCGRCGMRFSLTRTRALGLYMEPFRNLIHSMKYREKTDRDAHREYMRKYRESRVNHSNLQTLTVESPSVSVSGSVSGSEKEGSGEKGHKPQFVKPTIEEVKAYCTERKNGISAQAFIDHYESNGWMIGKNKMKSWQAAVRTWEHNQHEKNPGQKIGQVIGDRGEVLIYGKRRTDF